MAGISSTACREKKQEEFHVTYRNFLYPFGRVFSMYMYALQYGQICWNVLIMRKQSCCAGQLCDGRKGGGQWAWCVS